MNGEACGKPENPTLYGDELLIFSLFLQLKMKNQAANPSFSTAC